VNDILRERLQRLIEALPDDKAYQVLDYLEFLQSKYATRPAGAPAFQKVAEALEDTMRAGRVPVAIISRAMNAVATAGTLLDRVATAGKAAIEEAGRKPDDVPPVEEPPPPG
jgi:hypothetical protein